MPPINLRPFRFALRLAPRALALGCGAALAACSFQMKDLTRTGPQAAAPLRCADCHVAIYRDWAASKHARAFTDPAFLRATLGAQTPACLSCHAPDSILAEGPVATRADHREEGVTCNACHLYEGAQHGPFEPGPLTPHPTRVEPARFHSAELCGKCHAGTYATWSRATAGLTSPQTCQDCHMPLVRQKMTQATDLLSKGIVALHKERPLRRHVFDVEPTAGGFSATLADGGRLVRLRNLIPHEVPTGDFGERRARVEADWLAADGRVIATQARDLDKGRGTQLDPGAELTLQMPPASAAPARVRVRVRRIPGETAAAGTVVWRAELPAGGAEGAAI